LRHFLSPSAQLLKQALKLSCFLLVLFKLVSSILRPCRKLPLPYPPAILFQHLNTRMTRDGFDHLVVTP